MRNKWEDDIELDCCVSFTKPLKLVKTYQYLHTHTHTGYVNLLGCHGKTPYVGWLEQEARSTRSRCHQGVSEGLSSWLANAAFCAFTWSAFPLSHGVGGRKREMSADLSFSFKGLD